MRRMMRTRPFPSSCLFSLLALTLWAARREPPWAAAVLGAGLLPVLLDPSSYYTAIFLAFGALWTRRPEIGAALCALSAFGWLAAAGDRDPEQTLAWTSAAMLAFVAFTAAALLRGPVEEAPSP